MVQTLDILDVLVDEITQKLAQLHGLAGEVHAKYMTDRLKAETLSVQTSRILPEASGPRDESLDLYVTRRDLVNFLLTRGLESWDAHDALTYAVSRGRKTGRPSAGKLIRPTAESVRAKLDRYAPAKPAKSQKK